jgi:RNA methyltransferase, TrmH family
MLSKSQINLLKSLQQKKFRLEHGFFLVEGRRSIAEFAGSAYQVQCIYHTPAFDPKVLKLSQKINLCEISVTELEKISTLKTPQDAVAQIKVPEWPVLKQNDLQGQFSIVLDGIQDPGNMGTIIRIADWFGIGHIICSEDTVDAYNPKVIQACMGSLARVKVHYTDLAGFLKETGLPKFGALLNGDSIYNADFGSEGLIIMGNEGNGITPRIQQLITRAITIPRIGQAESLNVAVATALFCSEISRKSYK